MTATSFTVFPASESSFSQLLFALLKVFNRLPLQDSRRLPNQSSHPAVRAHSGQKTRWENQSRVSKPFTSSTGRRLPLRDACAQVYSGGMNREEGGSPEVLLRLLLLLLLLSNPGWQSEGDLSILPLMACRFQADAKNAK